MYMTSALKKTDVKAIGLQMALDLLHKKDKRDLITGLKTRTQAGRPDWDKVTYLLFITSLTHPKPYRYNNKQLGIAGKYSTISTINVSKHLNWRL